MSPRMSPWDPRTSWTGTTWTSPRPPSATTWPSWRSRASSSSRTPAPGRVPTDKGYRLFVDRLSGVKPFSRAERRAIETFLTGAYDLDDVVMRTVRLLAQLTRQVAVVQYPSLTRSAVRHIELVPLTDRRLLLVADHRHRPGRAARGRPARPGRRGLRHPAAGGAERLSRRAQADRGSVGRRRSARARRHARAAQRGGGVLGASWRPWWSGMRSAWWSEARLTSPRADFSKGLHEVLEALEEQVVLMRLLGESARSGSGHGADRRREPGGRAAEHVDGGHRLRFR